MPPHDHLHEEQEQHQEEHEREQLLDAARNPSVVAPVETSPRGTDRSSGASTDSHREAVAGSGSGGDHGVGDVVAGLLDDRIGDPCDDAGDDDPQGDVEQLGG